MKTIIVLMLAVSIAFAAITNPSTDGTFCFCYDTDPSGNGSTWYLLDMESRVMDSGEMPGGIMDACVNVENLPNGVYACIIVADGEIVESCIFTKL